MQNCCQNILTTLYLQNNILFQLYKLCLSMHCKCREPHIPGHLFSVNSRALIVCAGKNNCRTDCYKKFPYYLNLLIFIYLFSVNSTALAVCVGKNNCRTDCSKIFLFAKILCSLYCNKFLLQHWGQNTCNGWKPFHFKKNGPSLMIDCHFNGLLHKHLSGSGKTVFYSDFNGSFLFLK